MTEPRITIDGIVLTTGQAMTVRVALASFTLDVKVGRLGSDEHGVAVTAAYKARLEEILKLLGGE